MHFSIFPNQLQVIEEYSYAFMSQCDKMCSKCKFFVRSYFHLSSWFRIVKFFVSFCDIFSLAHCKSIASRFANSCISQALHSIFRQQLKCLIEPWLHCKAKNTNTLKQKKTIANLVLRTHFTIDIHNGCCWLNGTPFSFGSCCVHLNLMQINQKSTIYNNVIWVWRAAARERNRASILSIMPCNQSTPPSIKMDFEILARVNCVHIMPKADEILME